MKRAIGTGLAAALTMGAAWFGFGAATAGSQERVPTGDRSDVRGWDGRSAGSVADALQQAGAGRTVTVIATEVRGRGVDVGRPGESFGDFFGFEETLRNAGPGRRVVGKDAVRCELGIRTFGCHGMIRLNGRGKILVDGTLFTGRDNVLAVTGGTREFKGVGGELLFYDLRGNKSLLVLKLVG